MLYKDIIFNNQGIKEVRCANEVIWKKKISQLLQLFDSTGKNEARVNEICVRGKNIYAYCQREHSDRFIAKIVNENEKLRVVNTINVLSGSSVFVCDPKLDDIVYIVGRVDTSSYNDDLLCIDMRTSQKKVAYSYNLGFINSYGYNNDGIAIWDGTYIHYFKYNENRTSFSTATVSNLRYERPRSDPYPSIFTKTYTDTHVCFLSDSGDDQISPFQTQRLYIFGVGNFPVEGTYRTEYQARAVQHAYMPYDLSGSLEDYVSNLFICKGNSGYLIPAFVSKDGKLFTFDEDTVEKLNTFSYTPEKRQELFKIKLDVGNFRVFKCKYDIESNILFMSTENPVYENGKSIGFKVFKIDIKNNTSKLLASYELDQYSNYFGFDVDGADVYVGSKNNTNGVNIISILHEQLSVPTTTPVAPDSKSTLKPKYQWDIKDTTTYVKVDRVENDETYYKIRDEFVDKSKCNFHVCVYDDGGNEHVIFCKNVAGMNIKIPTTSIDGSELKRNNTDFLGNDSLTAGNVPSTYNHNGAQNCTVYYFEVEKEKISNDLNNEIESFIKSLR